MAVSPDILLGNIIMSRVRLARNFKNYPFKIKDLKTAKDVVKMVNRALVKTDTFNLYYVSNLDQVKLEAMKERHLISQNLIDNDTRRRRAKTTMFYAWTTTFRGV